MQFHEIENLIVKILQEAKGMYLLPYQVFTRLKQRDPSLGARIESAYPTQPGKPTMGEGAGIYYSPASFVAHALNHFTNKYPEIYKQWFDTIDIEVEGIIPGNKEGTSIWAWRPSDLT
jgi:PPE-repeat protein